MLLFEIVERRRWRGFGYRTITHELQGTCWRQAHFSSSDNQIEQNHQQPLSDGATRSNLHRRCAKSVELYVSFQKRLWSHLIDVRIMEILEDIMSSKLLSANFIETYKRYITVGRTTIKHQGLLFLLVKIDKKAPAVLTLGITHRDDPSFYTVSEKDSLIVTQMLTNSLRKRTTFPFPTQHPSEDTSDPSLTTFWFETWRKTISSFRPSHSFLMLMFIEP